MKEDMRVFIEKEIDGFIYYVLNEDFDDTRIDIKNVYCPLYEGIIKKTLEEFQKKFNSGDIPYLMTKFLQLKKCWAVEVRLEKEDMVQILEYTSIYDGENNFVNYYYGAWTDFENFKEDILNKELKIEDVKKLFKNFVELYRQAQETLFKDLPPETLFIYIFNPCWNSDKFHKKTVSMATTKLVEIDQLKALTISFLALIADGYAEEARKQAIQSAVAAIMSRNMSHNLGSHFITNTKNYFGNQADLTDDDQLKKDYRGIKHTLQYIQERMDYIATIVSGDQYPLGTLNTKAQLFDELTVNDFADRHEKVTTNFFLKYLVFSEKYSVYSDLLKPEGFHDVGLQIKYNGKTFTGKKEPKDAKQEKELKLELSQLNLAVPGGIMARHALFNIIENMMRNSAKHSKQDSQDLIITIEITKLSKDKKENVKEKYKHINDLLRVQIYDNKGNRESASQIVKGRLSNIQTLNPNGTMNNDNKGLKEMLICALWLQNENISKVLSEIDNAKNDKERYEIIRHHFRLLEDEENNENKNFGYEFELPEFEKVHTLDEIKPDTIIGICSDVVRYENKEARIIIDKENNRRLKDIFPRFTNDLIIKDEELEQLFISEIEDDQTKAETYYANLFKEASKNVLGNKIDFDKYEIIILDKENPGLSEKERNVVPKVIINPGNTQHIDNQIVFHNHLDTHDIIAKRKVYDDAKQAAYIESISGANFTKTLTSPDFFKNKIIQRYRVIESALTKIAIIDERIFEKCCHKAIKVNNQFIKDVDFCLNHHEVDTLEKFIEMITKDNQTTMLEINRKLEEHKESSSDFNFISERENIRLLCIGEYNTGEKMLIEEKTYFRKNVFIYNIDVDNSKIINLSNEYCGGILPIKLENKNFGVNVHFLTVHLGLLEKLLIKRKEKDKTITIDTILNEIREQFNPKFISIHSGRGNFSADLEKDLKNYPFISLSALEAAFDNSKYFLSQLFYNTIYYGKGNFNHK